MARVASRMGRPKGGGATERAPHAGSVAAPRGVKERQHYHWLAEVLRELEFHLHGRIAQSGLIPEEWHEIARERGEQPQEKVTITLEVDVVKFFRATGAGYPRRMADVLRAFMHARLSGLLTGAEGVSYAPLEGQEKLHRLAVLREYLDLEGQGAPPEA